MQQNVLRNIMWLEGTPWILIFLCTHCSGACLVAVRPCNQRVYFVASMLALELENIISVVHVKAASDDLMPNIMFQFFWFNSVVWLFTRKHILVKIFLGGGYLLCVSIVKFLTSNSVHFWHITSVHTDWCFLSMRFSLWISSIYIYK
jgi:hypothetical protein